MFARFSGVKLHIHSLCGHPTLLFSSHSKKTVAVLSTNYWEAFIVFENNSVNASRNKQGWKNLGFRKVFRF